MPVDKQMIFRIMILAVAALTSIRDIKNKEIPLALLLIAGTVSVVFGILGVASGELFVAEVILPLIPGILFLLISLVTREGVGIGDGLFILCTAIPFGAVGTFVGISIALCLSAAFAVIILVSGKGSRKSRLPFVPFIAIGMGVCTCAGI